jgi:hypothetical protein
MSSRAALTLRAAEREALAARRGAVHAAPASTPSRADAPIITTSSGSANAARNRKDVRSIASKGGGVRGAVRAKRTSAAPGNLMRAADRGSRGG